MHVLAVRHAKAEDRATFAATKQPDSHRRLTRKGVRKMNRAARGLRSLVPSIDLVVSSPLLRATETAQIIADCYGGVRRIERDELAPGSNPRLLIDWLAAQRQKSTICIVGHEPDLSQFLKLFLADKSKQPAKLKKGSVTFVDVQGRAAVGAGTLGWYRSAGHLASQS